MFYFINNKKIFNEHGQVVGWLVMLKWIRGRIYQYYYSINALIKKYFLCFFSGFLK